MVIDTFRLRQEKTGWEAWLVWCLGIEAGKVLPFYKLTGADFHHRDDQLYFSHIKKVCQVMLDPAVPTEAAELTRFGDEPQLAHSRAHKAFQRLFRKLPALPGKQMNAKSCGELKVRTMALRITSSQPERRKRKNSNKKNKRRRRSGPPSGSSSKRSKPTTSSTASVDL